MSEAADYHVALRFDSEEQRGVWVASDEHAVAWP